MKDRNNPIANIKEYKMSVVLSVALACFCVKESVDLYLKWHCKK